MTQTEEPTTMSTMTGETGVETGREPAEAGSNEPERARRRWPWWLAGFVVLAAIGATIVVVTNGGGGDEAAADTTLNFADVVVTDLVETETYDATLGTVDGDPITSHLSGTLTWAADEGATVSQGEPLFAVDGDPVILMYGATPAYRDLGPTENSVEVTSHLSGILTGVVEDGATLEQGDVAFRVGGEPVVILYGDVPAYRSMQDLSDNMEGDDVLQLETDLADLGYAGFTVDGTFTSATESAVEDWQADIGATEDGIVDLGDVVFLPGPATVLDVSASIGDSIGEGLPVVTVSGATPSSGDDVLQLEQSLSDLGYDAAGSMVVDGTWDSATTAAVQEWQAAVGLPVDGVVDLGEVVFNPGPVRVSDQLSSVGTPIASGTAVLGNTSADKVVTLDLPASDQGVVAEGTAVVVELPDGTDVPATVQSVSAVATVSSNGSPVFEVTIALDDPSVAGSLDEAPVNVDVVTDSAEGVMAVPVTALLALAEGGYAVQVESGTTTRLVAVDPGFFAQGLVEVTSSELQPGDRVVVP